MAATDGGKRDMSRRQFLAASAASAGLLWQPIRRLTPSDPEAGAPPPGFPSDVKLYRQVYENWALEIRVDDVWVAVAESADDVVNVANWAMRHGWQVRPSGARHGWAPFNVVPDQARSAKVVLVDTRQLDLIGVDKKAKTVYAQAGATLDDIMVALQNHGLGFSSIPAPGVVTIAGALAVNGHGAALPARGENTAGRSYGSLSNRVVSLKAVVFDAASRTYKITTFDRTNPATKAMLTSLGRVFITSVVLRAETNMKLRCVSYTDITNGELFGAPGAGGRSFASFLERTGRAEAILFPFTNRAWFKTWEESPKQPEGSREVSGPYNYPFSDNIPLPLARLIKRVVAGDGPSARQFGRTSLRASELGLTATDTYDIWGDARNTQHYIKPSTIRASEFGYAVITARANVQRVLHEFVTKYESLVNQYAARDLYPATMPIELRCTGLDDASYVGVPGAEPPSLSALTPVPEHPEWDTGVFINSLNLVGSGAEHSFKADLEGWLLQNYRAPYALARVEWSKGWGYTDNGGWRNPHVLHTTIPQSLPRWHDAIATLRQLDPHNLFGNEFLDRLFG